MNRKWINWITIILLVSSCHNKYIVDGFSVENQILLANDLSKDYTDPDFLKAVISDVNCADSGVLKKRLVLEDEFHSQDTSEILLIPFVSNGKTFKSSAYSDIKNRFVLINPTYIKEFTRKNTLNDTSSYKPVLELMLLHEIGHFILKKNGAFDEIINATDSVTGQRKDNSQPEYLTTIKKIELSADSLAVDIVKRNLNPDNRSCLDIAFGVERIIPGMQFQLSGTRIIENFGSENVGFLHDPSNDHPNLELRITFMNYFLFPNDSLREMIDDYLYNRTVAPVHRQEFDPRLFQGKEKKFSE